MRKFFLPLLFVFLFHGVAFSGGKHPSKESQEIRVLLSSYSSDLELSVHGSFSLIGPQDKVFLQRKRGASMKFKTKMGKLYLGKKKLGVTSVWVIPTKEGTLRFRGNRYRGKARIFVDKKGKLSLINVLNVEDYLKSVVAGEVSPKWPKEVLKAQAVAARTYAYYHMVKNKDLPAQITSPLAQNYQGMKKENKATNDAVKLTRSQVLYYRKYLFPTFFHSTCGGGTEFPQNVWPLEFKIPEVVPCDYCKESPHFRWEAKLTFNEIERKFKDAGKPIPPLVSIYPSKISKNRSHITEITLVTRKKEISMRINEFRHILGFNLIKSSKFKINSQKNRIAFNGWGWGHGVGMCQWGAKTLAQDRKSYRKILSYYYPGCRLKKVL